MAGYILPANGPKVVILADKRDPWQSWRNHLARGSAGGVDVVAAVGTPVYAPAAGTVSLARWNGTAGHTITLNQPGGWKDQFMHMREPNPMAVPNGASVAQGQLIGWTGNTANGRVGGVAQHLHWHRLDASGARKNPWDYFTASGGGGASGYGYGLSSDAQRAAQGALQKLGLYGGAIDGAFGAQSVKAFQQYLKNVGLLPGSYAVDGEPGPTYGRAIQELAKRHGYTGPIDGAPGASTSTAIIEWAKSVGSPAPAPSPGTAGGYAYGLSDEAQRLIQEALKKLGLYNGSIDGAFGSLSVAAVQLFLRSVSLLPATYAIDGQPGPTYGKALQTWAAKFGYTGAIDGVPGEKTSEALITWARSVLGVAPTPTPTPTPTPAPTAGSFGIDISRHQEGIDLARAKSEGVEFVIVKMGGYNVKPLYTSSTYSKQVDEARAQGLKVGHYWVIGGVLSPENQADYFAANLHNFDVDNDVLALDNENLDSNGTTWKDAEAARFFRRVIARTGIPASRLWHYAGASDYRTLKPWPEIQALGVKIWWAAFGSYPTGRTPDHEPNLQGSVADWHIHQYTSKASVAGLSVDGNYSRLSIDELFGVGSPTSPVSPSPAPAPVPTPVPAPEPTPAPLPPGTIPEPPATDDPKAKLNWVVIALTAVAGIIASIISYLTGTAQ